MTRLKAKRFRQIFNYLDQDQEGVIDLLDIATSMPRELLSVVPPPSSPPHVCHVTLLHLATFLYHVSMNTPHSALVLQLTTVGA